MSEVSAISRKRQQSTAHTRVMGWMKLSPDSDTPMITSSLRSRDTTSITGKNVEP